MCKWATGISYTVAPRHKHWSSLKLQVSVNNNPIFQRFRLKTLVMFMALLFFLIPHICSTENPIGPHSRVWPLFTTLLPSFFPKSPTFLFWISTIAFYKFPLFRIGLRSVYPHPAAQWYCWDIKESTQNPPVTFHFARSESLAVPWTCQAISYLRALHCSSLHLKGFVTRSKQG